MLLAALTLALSAGAQETMPDPGAGALRGRVVDAATGKPIEGVAVDLVSTETELKRTTDAQGGFAFEPLPADTYALRFRKAGYRDSKLEQVVVRDGAETRADFSLPTATPDAASETKPGAAPGAPVDIEEFVVIASPVAEILSASRMSSDELLNTLNAEEISKFAASDVADALKYVPGVSVSEGQFAIIRGLEDRYSSTLYNNAPVPSPDPDRQSVQLDLFASEIVSNLAVSKTFAPELQGNSSGGAIGIITTDENPEESFDIKIKSGGGFNSRAIDRFLRFDEGLPTGVEEDPNQVIEREWGGSVKGAREIFDRQLRLKALYNKEIDYETLEGWYESREPAQALFNRDTLVQTGDLSLGELNATNGRFDLTESERTEQTTAYIGTGLDLDAEGNHKIDGSWFSTKKTTESVQLRENGYLPGIDYAPCVTAQLAGDDTFNCLNSDRARRKYIGSGAWINDLRETGQTPAFGYFWSNSFQDTLSFDTTRELHLLQLNGDHRGTGWLDGLHLSWAANRAHTKQSERTERMRYAYPFVPTGTDPEDFVPEVPGGIPVLVVPADGAQWLTADVFDNRTEIDEKARFWRADLDYEFEPDEVVTLRFNGGYWWEKSDRDVAASYLQNPTVGGESQWFFSSTRSPKHLAQLADAQFDAIGTTFSGTQSVESTAERKIKAWNAGAKATFWDRVDVFGGLRREHIEISSQNDPFTGEVDAFDGAPRIFPSAYLFFDRRDNPNRPIERPAPPPGITYNDEILGLDIAINPDTGFVDFLTREQLETVLNGVIDRAPLLPSVGFSVRPIEGLTIRGAYSRTVARPSFREIGYYVSVDPGTDDLVVGNPQLQLSEVSSWDLRFEYWSGEGDGGAVSLFRKEIEDPIESIILRDPSNFEGGTDALYRTFFNNPSKASLRGIEAEARKHLGLFGWDFGRYITVGGNFTYIDASVRRTEAELARAQVYFGVQPGEKESFHEYEDKRRLFNQPKWIANADVSFKQPDWGTELTVAYYAISSVLDAAGSAGLDQNGNVSTFTLDRYVDSYYQLDVVFSQRIPLKYLPGDMVLKASGKNLTDTRRRLIYDPQQLEEQISERAFRIGRDFALSLTYSLSF